MSCPFSLLGALCELKMPSAISVNKECCSHEAITLQPPWVSPEGLSMRSTEIRHIRHITGMISGSLGSYPPIHRKALHFLTWDTWSSLIDSNLLVFQLPGLDCKNSYTSWLPPLPLQNSLWELPEVLSLRLKPSALFTKSNIALNFKTGHFFVNNCNKCFPSEQPGISRLALICPGKQSLAQ